MNQNVNVLFVKKGKSYWAIIRQLPHDAPVVVGKRYGRHGVVLEVKADIQQAVDRFQRTYEGGAA